MADVEKKMMRERKRSLDVLRAAAVFLVFLNHMLVCPRPINRILFSLTYHGELGGWVGVDLFFVLSGFLISGLLFKEHQNTGSISFRRFFIRRGFKIYPAFYVFIAATLIFGLRPDPPVLSRAWHELVFLQNYLEPLWRHTWSLAVEEHFYLALPLLLIFLSRNKNRPSPFKSLPYLFLFLAVFSLTARVLKRLPMPPGDFGTHKYLAPTHLRLDALFFGVLISYIYHYHKIFFIGMQKRFGLIFLVLGPLLFLPAFYLSRETSFFVLTFGATFYYFGAGMLLVALVDREELFKGKFWALIAFIGSHSYSIYLWHVFIISSCEPARKFYDSWYAYYFLCLAGSITMGVMMARLVEYPALWLREKWFPDRAVSPADK